MFKASVAWAGPINGDAHRQYIDICIDGSFMCPIPGNGHLSDDNARSSARQPRYALRSSKRAPTHPPPAAFRAFAAQIKIAIGIVQARSCSLKVLLKSGCLDGKDVQVRNKNNEVLLRGTVVEHGLIACACKLCKGKAWSCSSFEAHSGSTAHRPAEFIFLTEFGRSLKVCWHCCITAIAVTRLSTQDLIALVAAEDLDVHDEVCGTCKEGGDLLCCGSCPRAYHAHCVGLSAASPVRIEQLSYRSGRRNPLVVVQAEWFCKDCVLAQVAAAEAAAAAAAAKYKPNKLKRAPLSSYGKGLGRPPKRLRMSAPQIRGQHRRNKGNGSRNKLLFTRSNGALQVRMYLGSMLLRLSQPRVHAAIIY